MGFLKKGHIIVLLINIAIACIVLFLIGYIVLKRLDKYTNHGYYITVPELRGFTPDEAESFAKDKNLQILVIDSIYDNYAKPGTIVEQFPSPNAHVKNNRAIQLTINANAPEKIIFPNLRNVAFRQSLQRLKNLGINVGRIEYAPSNFKNLVLDFKYKGNIIEPNSLIQKGETVDIVLGNGNTSNDQVAIPLLVGKTLAEAKALLLRAFLNVGEILPDNTVKSGADQSTAIVYQQMPEFEENMTMKMGGDITLYLTKDKEKIMALDSLSIEEQQP